MKTLRNQRGFTLIEVILSIAVLALLSGFILQFFLAADRVNQRAGQVDQAHMLAVTVMEAYKAQPAPFLTTDSDPALALAAIDGDSLTAWFDADWQPLPSGQGAAFVLHAQAQPQGERHALPTGDGTEYGQLMRLTLDIQALDPGQGSGETSQPLLTENAVQRYFLWKEAGT